MCRNHVIALCEKMSRYLFIYSPTKISIWRVHIKAQVDRSGRVTLKLFTSQWVVFVLHNDILSTACLFKLAYNPPSPPPLPISNTRLLTTWNLKWILLCQIILFSRATKLGFREYFSVIEVCVLYFTLLVVERDLIRTWRCPSGYEHADSR